MGGEAGFWEDGEHSQTTGQAETPCTDGPGSEPAAEGPTAPCAPVLGMMSDKG